MNIPDMHFYKGLGLAILIILVYVWFMFKYAKENKSLLRFLGGVALFIFVTNGVADFIVMSEIAGGEYNIFALFILSVFHSLELFAFQTHFFDNGYQEFFFGKDCAGGGCTFFVYLFSLTFVLAAITSSVLIIKAIRRRRDGRSWLDSNKDKASKTHIFFLGGEISWTLAKDIQSAHPSDSLVFVGYPSPEEGYVGLSVWEKIKRLFKSRPEEVIGPWSTIIYSKIPLSETTGKDICQQMGLKDLDVFLKTPACKVYLLSDDEEENLHCAELLYGDGCVAEIFCRACREGANRMYEDAMTKTPSVNVHLIDSSYLAVRNIKNCCELLPVNYVKKGLDENGFMEGWAASEFNAMVLGFGEMGREMLGFLYEYGAFVDKDFKKSPFSCVVLDKQMGQFEQAYRKSFLGMNEAAGITFKQCEIGSNEFWDEMSEQIQRLNYIVVCLGNDRINLRMAVDLVDFAFRKGKDMSKNFVILIAQKDPTHLDDVTLKHYNAIGQYHNCIRTFGNKKDVWTYDNMTNESLKNRAKNYFAGYMRAQGDTRNPDEIWEKREKEIVTTPDFALHAKRVRQRSQDYANCFHISTKMALIGPEIYDCRRDIAQCIPPDYMKTHAHYTGTELHVEKVLHYLAVLEHIRWEASHVALGYAPGKRTDEVKKTHECIMNYDELTPEVQHYDYLVVKTTFELA